MVACDVTCWVSEHMLYTFLEKPESHQLRAAALDAPEVTDSAIKVLGKPTLVKNRARVGGRREECGKN
jgi:hypothetical protein